MAGRIRTIKPEVLDDEVASGLSDAAWRMWVSSWVLADDHGNLRARAKNMAADVWKDTSRDAETPLQELIDKGRFRPYAVKGQRYVHIHAWDKHQRIDNASKNRLPAPEEDDGTWDQPLTTALGISRREPPRTSANGREPPPISANFGEIPLRARAPAQSGGETSDLRPRPRPVPTTTSPAASAASAFAGTSDASGLKHKLPPSETKLWGKHRKNLYTGAVARALGDTWGFDDKQLGKMHDVIAAHCIDKTKIDEWLDATVFAFVTAVKGEDAKYWSAYQPKGLLRWLNEGGARGVANGHTNGSSSGVTRQIVNGQIVNLDGSPVDE